MQHFKKPQIQLTKCFQVLFVGLVLCLPLWGDISIWQIIVLEAIVLLYNNQRIKETYKTWKNIVACTFLAFLLLISIFGSSNYLERTLEHSLFERILFGLIILIVFVCSGIPLGIKIIDCWGQYTYREKRNVIKGNFYLGFWIRFVIGMLVIGVYLLAYNPAIMYWDSFYQIAQAHNLIPYDNWHPLFITLLYKVLLKICDSITFLAIFQAAMFVAAIAAFVNWLAFQLGNQIFPTLCMILFVALPCQALNSISIIKDVPYCASIVFLTYILSREWIERNERISCIQLIEVVLCIMVCWLSRSNGFVAVIGFMVALLIFNWKKGLLVLGGTLFSLCLWNTLILHNIDYVEIPSGAKYNAMVCDMQVVKMNGGILNDESNKILENVFCDDQLWLTYYEMNETNVLQISDASFLDNYPKRKVIGAYLDCFERYPLEMIRAALIRVSVGWDVSNYFDGVTLIGETAYISSTEAMNLDGNWFADLGFHDYGERNETKLMEILDEYILWTKEKEAKIFFWNTGYHWLIIVLLLCYAVCRKPKMLLAFFPILFHCAGLVLCLCWTNYRYFWPIEVAAFMLMWLPGIGKTTERSNLSKIEVNE